MVGDDLTRAGRTVRDEAESLAAELAVAMPHAPRVAEGCSRLAAALPPRLTDADVDALGPLAAALRSCAGDVVLAAFEVLAAAVARAEHPAPLLSALLEARKPECRRRAVELAARVAESPGLEVDETLVSDVARSIEADAGAGPPIVRAAGRLAARLRPALDHDAALDSLYAGDAALPVRRLAARRLDLDEAVARVDRVRRVLGGRAARFLLPYLQYTRASHADVLELSAPGRVVRVIRGLRRVERTCGAAVLRDALSRLGWRGINHGVKVRRLSAVSLSGSYPFPVRPEEARLLTSCGAVLREEPVALLVAHRGEAGGGAAGTADAEAPASRFRRYSLRHAELLPAFLDLAPLTADRTARILDGMDRIVADHLALFSGRSPEVDALPSVYAELVGRVRRAFGLAGSQPHLSPELTRLVQTFEDPRSLGEVRTLHGLKRHLHQTALALGMRLVAARRETDRTVSVAAYRGGTFAGRLPEIRYVAFEPEPGGRPNGIPHAVEVVVEGFARQLMAGHTVFPDVRVFVYGNEVHYYLGFGSHPAFLRIHWAPPLSGGMIDLEFYGVSKCDLTTHPDPGLPTLTTFLRTLGFDANVDGTRVHARYDKERALGLGELCTTAEALFRLVPHLMDLDWAVGGIDLPAEAREVLVREWASWFARWGVLPMAELLSADRRRVRAGVEPGPTGPRELTWDGRAPYRVPFDLEGQVEVIARLRAKVAALGVEPVPEDDLDAGVPPGPVALERSVWRPLREARACGLIDVVGGQLERVTKKRVRPEHETERFANLLAGSSADLESAASTARLVAPLERALPFVRSGSVEGLVTERARLELPGRALGLYVLRDASGIGRLAVYTEQPFLLCRRDAAERRWESNARVDGLVLAELLRGNDFPAPVGMVDPSSDSARDARSVLASVRESSPSVSAVITGEPVVEGIAASPGRALGPAVFGTEGRSPSDVAGAVLCAATITPADGPFIHRAAGVVTTGGGILSHAGLLAAQFGKPALTVAGGWSRTSDGGRALTLRYREYRETTRHVAGFEVVLREDVAVRERVVRERDLLAVDAHAGLLRVVGEGREASTLHGALVARREAERRLVATVDPRERLVARGRRLRATHVLEKLLGTLGIAALARVAIEELLLGEHAHGIAPGTADLLRVVVRNPAVGPAAAALLSGIAADLRGRSRWAAERAVRCIPRATDLAEILELRLSALRRIRVCSDVVDTLRDLDLAPSRTGEERVRVEIDGPARRRIERLAEEARREVVAAGLIDGDDGVALDLASHPAARHALRTLERCQLVLGEPEDPRRVTDQARGRVEQADEAHRESLGHRRLIGPSDGGIELAPLIGWKAANLGEVRRLAGERLVPGWFAVTDSAFREVLGGAMADGGGGSPPETLLQAVEAVLADPGLDPGRQAARIRGLWERVRLPAALVDELAAAYRVLGPEGSPDVGAPYVAVRSSSHEEDTETATRAGEFDTFLFVRDVPAVVEHVKRAWCGLWTERAIRTRRLHGEPAREVGGGVIVQRIVRARVSGVVQSVNVAEGEFGEIVINAGLGLGEGIVSGVVAADHVTVVKPHRDRKGPLRFRYRTADKTEQVVFDERTGHGTVRRETVYHQRLRAALEYVELVELVDVVLALERAYGYPLDLEFAIEGARLFVLQVRPVPWLVAAVRETTEHYPLPSSACTATTTVCEVSS